MRWLPRLVLVLASVGLSVGLSGSPRVVTAPGCPGEEPGPTNVLLLILDDVGRDKIACYGVSGDAGPTPVIDGLAARGVRFDCAWATPYCSPTRATILTGRHPYRTGLGEIVNFYRRQPGLALSERLLPEAARELGLRSVSSGLVGKWHLAGAEDGQDHPRESGFERFAGTMANLGRKSDPGAYERAAWVVDGAPAPGRGYATTVTVDAALAMIAAFESQGADAHEAGAAGTEERGAGARWFVTVSFHAAHFPLHAPPAELHGFELAGDPLATPLAHHRAMVEALDREIGRLLAGLEEDVLARTTVIVVGDNGTQNNALGAPLRSGTGKGTLFEAGVGVPLIIAGPGVSAPGRSTSAFAQTVDLFPTTLELLAGRTVPGLGAGTASIDGVSLVPLLESAVAAPPRDTLYTEWFRPNHAPPAAREAGGRAIRRGPYKLISAQLGREILLFDLVRDPQEERNLLGVDSVSAELAAVRDELLSALDEFR